MRDDDAIPASPAHREQEALQHVLREVRGGRQLADALEDRYVIARMTGGTRGRLLDHPELAAAVGAGVASDLRRLRDEQRTPPTRSPEPEPAPDAGIDDALRAQLRAIDPTP